jgi:hypothetical protein
MAGAAAGSPLADAGVPAPGGLPGRADLDFAAGQVRWRVQDQRAGVCADLQHDSAGLGGTVVFIGTRPAGLLPAPRGGKTQPLLATELMAGDELGLTVEPAGGTAKPTTTPILVIPVRA